MPRGVYENFKCKKDDMKNRDEFNITPHQQKVLDYFPNSPYKGLLLFHKLGSGKTCTSITVADEMLRLKKIKKVVILSPGSLRTGWIKEYCKICGYSAEFINKYFIFITYNFDVYEEVAKLDFNNVLLIIDEIHNLINGVKNNSVNATFIYNKAMKSDCRILALSGTPIVNNEIEWAFLGNLLKPGTFPNYVGLGLDKTQDPKKLFGKFKITDEQLQGIVSFFPGDVKMYPKVTHHPPIITLMSTNQAIKYDKAYWFEFLTKRPDPELKGKNPAEYDKQLKEYIRAKKFETSRRVSNFFYGVPHYITKDDGEEVLVDFAKLPDKLSRNGGWVNNDALDNKKLLLEYSAKFTSIIVNILLHWGTKHVIFSWYKSKGGVEILNTLFQKCGIKSEIFSGDLSDAQRISLLNTFNSPNNRNGEIITILLITDAGAEGINILETNNIHITESSTNQMRINQVIGRVVRYKSHINLPPDRQYVNVWRYWSKPNPKNIGVDEILYNDGIEKIKEIKKFEEKLIDNSIETQSYYSNLSKLKDPNLISLD